MMLILSANISNLPNKYEALTPHNVILGIYAILFASFSALYFMTLPKVVVMVLYIALLFLSTCVVPFLSQFAMDYVKMGHDINFGLARGLGSFSYASSAFLMGYLVEWLEPSVIYIVFVISSILFIINLFVLPHSINKFNGQFSFFATYTYYCNDVLSESDQMAGQTLITMMANGFGFCLGNYLGGVLQDTLGLQSMLIFAMAVTLVGALIGVCTYKFMKED